MVQRVKRRLALIQVLRHREPALLVAGQTVSTFGDGVSLVVLTLFIIETTHSVSKLAWFAAARMVPLVVFLLVGGVVVDRFSRRTLLLISDSARAILTGLLCALIALGVLTFSELLIFGFFFGLFDALFTPAMSALTPEIVDEDLLPAMNALRPLTSNLVGGMIGPAVGGVLAAWSTAGAIGLDAGTFVISAAAVALMRATPKPERHVESTMLADIREGVHYVTRTRWIWTTLVTVTFTNALILTPMFVLLPFFLRHDLHSSKTLVGFAFAVGGASGALGALVAGNLKMPRRRVRVMWTYWTIGSLAVLIFAVATNYWEVLFVPLIVSPMALMGNVIWESMLQSEVPRSLLGRVSSVDFFVSYGLSPVGLVVAGLLSGAVGVRTYFVVAAIVLSLPGLYILASRRINEVDRERVSRARTGEPRPTTVPPIESPS
jgi:DHA3 family tetracycline resistance protein-like MFS transporter